MFRFFLHIYISVVIIFLFRQLTAELQVKRVMGLSHEDLEFASFFLK